MRSWCAKGLMMIHICGNKEVMDSHAFVFISFYDGLKKLFLPESTSRSVRWLHEGHIYSSLAVCTGVVSLSLTFLQLKQ